MKRNVNKTKLVKRILDEIGAIGDSPPYNWKRMVDERLLQEGVDPSKVNSYAIRHRAAKESHDLRQVVVQPVTSKSQQVVSQKFPTVDEIRTTLQPLMELKNLIKKVGGKDNLLRYLDLVDKFSI